jgi:CRP-like cAMP-binding protein
MDAAALLIGNANWSSEKCVKLLRSTELFGKFPYGALRSLLLASRLVSLKTSRRLFAGNEVAQSGFLLAEGVLRYDRSRSSDQPAYLTPPAIIGETALIIGCVRPVTVVAEADSVLIEIPRATFLRVIAEYPQSAAHARRLLFDHLRKLVAGLEAVQVHLDAVAADSESAADAIQSGARWPDRRADGEV